MKRAEHELRALWGREILQELFETDQGEEWGQRRESLLSFIYQETRRCWSPACLDTWRCSFKLRTIPIFLFIHFLQHKMCVFENIRNLPACFCQFKCLWNLPTSQLSPALWRWQTTIPTVVFIRYYQSFINCFFFPLAQLLYMWIRTCLAGLKQHNSGCES